MWWWQDADQAVDLAELDGTDFASQAEAEDWLSASYEELAEAGVAAVSLYQDDQLVYGPMPLSA